MFSKHTLLILVAGLSLGACGITAPRGEAGYADLDSLGVLDTDRTLTISVGPAILHFAAAHVEDDPEAEALLKNLDGVRVRIYEVEGDAARVAGRLERMSDDLQQDGWEPVAVLREEDEQVHMLIKTDDERMAGMVVMAMDDDREVVLVNLIGQLEPALFGSAMIALDIDAPEVKVASAN